MSIDLIDSQANMQVLLKEPEQRLRSIDITGLRLAYLSSDRYQNRHLTSQMGPFPPLYDQVSKSSVPMSRQ